MHLESTLHLDIEQDVHALAELFLDICFGRTVGVRYILRMLKKFVICDHIAELVKIDKEVFLAVYLAGAGLPGCCGN